MPSSPHEGATATVFCHPTHRDRRQRQDRPMKRNTKMAGRELRQEQAIASGGGMRRGKRELTEEKVGHDLAWAEEAPAAARTVEDRDPDEPEETVTTSSEIAEGEDAHGADDALGLYLRQMGAIPLLSREEELTLARRLERERTRFRMAALSNWQTLKKVIDTFERVQAGQLAVDPTIDVVTSLKLSREQILARMPHNLRTLRQLLK